MRPFGARIRFPKPLLPAARLRHAAASTASAVRKPSPASSRCADRDDAQHAVLTRGHVGQLDQVAGPHRAVADEQQRARPPRRARPAPPARRSAPAAASRSRSAAATTTGAARRGALAARAGGCATCVGPLFARGAERDDRDGRRHRRADRRPRRRVGAVAAACGRRGPLDGPEVERPVAGGRQLGAGQARQDADVRPRGSRAPSTCRPGSSMEPRRRRRRARDEVVDDVRRRLADVRAADAVVEARRSRRALRRRDPTARARPR